MSHETPVLHYVELERRLGEQIEAIMVVGLVGTGVEESPIAWMECDASKSGQIFAFSNAIIKEDTYLDAVMGFDELIDPVHDREMPADMSSLSGMLDVDRALCVIVMTRSRAIVAARDFDGVEMTRIESVRNQFKVFTDELACRGGWLGIGGHA